jgi:hypothetical protein
MLLCVYSQLKNIEYCTCSWTRIKHMLPICTEPQTLNFSSCLEVFVKICLNIIQTDFVVLPSAIEGRGPRLPVREVLGSDLDPETGYCH